MAQFELWIMYTVPSHDHSRIINGEEESYNDIKV